MLKAGGIILCMISGLIILQKDVKGVSKNEIKKLFAQADKIDFTNVTLAPPVGRRIGSLYPLINAIFPFLHSHIIAVIKK